LVGVSVPTVGRYEEGSLRIGAARLGAVSKALKTTIPYFFEDVPPLDEYDTEARAAQAQEVHTKDQIVKDQIVSNETLEIVRLCAKLDAPRRRQLLELVRAWVADLSPPDPDQ
jgi:transcriptional regulator with XRE-family HTH domain